MMRYSIVEATRATSDLPALARSADIARDPGSRHAHAVALHTPQLEGMARRRADITDRLKPSGIVASAGLMRLQPPRTLATYEEDVTFSSLRSNAAQYNDVGYPLPESEPMDQIGRVLLVSLVAMPFYGIYGLLIWWFKHDPFIYWMAKHNVGIAGLALAWVGPFLAVVVAATASYWIARHLEYSKVDLAGVVMVTIFVMPYATILAIAPFYRLWHWWKEKGDRR